ncbi:MAG: TolC family protein [Chitinispirillales bacterium]|jgi:outer membrane protein TolC|nr:TolC family protein [Chitinispirillales bacterium]
MILRVRKLLFGMFVATIISAVPILAQAPLTLEQCIAMALQSNLRIEIANEKLVEMDAVIEEASTARRPTLTGQATYTRLVPQPDNPMADLGGFMATFGLPAPNNNLSGNVFNVGLNLNQPLYTGGRITNARRIAEHGRVASEWQRKSAIREIRRDVTKAYYQALAVNKSVIALDSAIALMEVMTNDLSNAVEVGMRGEHELLQAQVQLLTQRLNRQQVATMAATAHDYLATLIGVPVNTPITLVNELHAPESFNLPNLEIMQLRARDASTDLKALGEQINILETSLLITNATHLPTIFASAGYSGGQPAGSPAGEFTWNNNTMLTLGMQWDIYSGGAVNHRRQQALSQKRQLELTIENLQLNLDMAVKSSSASLRDAFAGIETGRQNIEQSKRSYEISYDKFQEGMLLSSELLNAQNVVLQAEISFYSSLSNFYTLQADLDYLMND